MLVNIHLHINRLHKKLQYVVFARKPKVTEGIIARECRCFPTEHDILKEAFYVREQGRTSGKEALG